MPEVFIVWGEEGAGVVPTKYEFATQAELDAFLKGVDEGGREHVITDTPFAEKWCDECGALVHADKDSLEHDLHNEDCSQHPSNRCKTDDEDDEDEDE